ncbi:uncharacterized protein TNCT_450281 [Trichonephila clavata]|uniref:Uncharacterized protein n=1 Tax=Trichonephila clavata TaxID=2740835 RepID=A0A8X6KL35_TRICU|nr:uncharacterized protein TNCT_450281 [Trichonephila clavata]
MFADEEETRPASTQFRVWFSTTPEAQDPHFIQVFTAEFRRRLLHALGPLEMELDPLQNIQDLINQTGRQPVFPHPTEPPVSRTLPHPPSRRLLPHPKDYGTNNSNPSKRRKITRCFIAISLMIGAIVLLYPTIRQLFS